MADKSKKGTPRTMFRLELWVRSADQAVADKLRVRLYDALTDGESSKPNSKARVPEFEVSCYYPRARHHQATPSHPLFFFFPFAQFKRRTQGP